MQVLGAGAFGVVTGYITYRTLRRVKTSGISDIATVIGIVGGAAVTGIFPKDTDVFGAYGVGLAAGFFIYLAISLLLAARTNTLSAANEWLGELPMFSPNLPEALPRPTGQAPVIPTHP